jgi:hypothetical protein
MSRTTHARRLLAIGIALIAVAAAGPVGAVTAPAKPNCGLGGGPTCGG